MCMHWLFWFEASNKHRFPQFWNHHFFYCLLKVVGCIFVRRNLLIHVLLFFSSFIEQQLTYITLYGIHLMNLPGILAQGPWCIIKFWVYVLPKGAKEFSLTFKGYYSLKARDLHKEMLFSWRIDPVPRRCWFWCKIIKLSLFALFNSHMSPPHQAGLSKAPVRFSNR